MIYYIADTHFGHKNSLQFDSRPFNDVNEMDQVLIHNWNSVVTDEDTVYILGDFVYRSGFTPVYYLKQLKGKKHLIIGNHDSHVIRDNLAIEYFESVNYYLEIKDGDHLVVLCHYPIAEWNQYRRNSYHVYGHIHNNRDETFKYMCNQVNALNAGCMINGYKPVTLEELKLNNSIFQTQWKKS